MVFATTLATLGPRLRFKLNSPKIENLAFKFHYQVTVTLLMLAVVLVCAREFIGDHIKCMGDIDKDFVKAVENFCFSLGTFTIERYYNERMLKTNRAAHPGVGPLLQNDDNEYIDKLLFHKFYQWVPFLLVVQAILFYLPHYVWKKKEAGRIKMLVEGLENATLAQDEELKCNKISIPSKKNLDKKIQAITKDVILRLRLNRTWSVWLVAMEIVNLVHVILEIWLIDKFLDGQFLGLGPRLLNYRWEGVIGPLESIFPKVTKCMFNYYGKGGSVQNIDAMCMMALNVIHEKIFTAMWFWFLFLFIVSLCAVIWRISSYFLYRLSPRFSEVMFRKASSAKLDKKRLARVVAGCQFGDWLFLYYLAKNMKAIVFQSVFNKVAAELQEGGLLDEDNEHQKKYDDPNFTDKIGFIYEKPPHDRKGSQ